MENDFQIRINNKIEELVEELNKEIPFSDTQIFTMKAALLNACKFGLTEAKEILNKTIQYYVTRNP